MLTAGNQKCKIGFEEQNKTLQECAAHEHVRLMKFFNQFETFKKWVQLTVLVGALGKNYEVVTIAG